MLIKPQALALAPLIAFLVLRAGSMRVAVGALASAACVVGFLNIIHLPGAWVWGALTFFSELVPKLGVWIARIPLFIVAGFSGGWTLLGLSFLASYVIEDIKAYVRDTHSAYAYPREIEFVADLPKTLTGKIRRIELREAERAKKKAATPA